LLCGATGLHVKGSMELDAWTFDKVVGGASPVLVKFDKDYAYGDKEDAFKEVCKRVGESGANVHIGVVGVQEYGDKMNADLAKRFGVSKDDFPEYYLFKAGSSEPIKFNGEVKPDEITRFLKTEAGLYVALPGCVKEFDELAALFMKDTENRATHKAAAEAAVQKLTNAGEVESGKYYAMVMKKILDKGDSFAMTEIDRLTKMVGGASITEDRKVLFQKRLNILPSFKEGSKPKGWGGQRRRVQPRGEQADTEKEL